MEQINDLLSGISPPDGIAMAEAARRQDSLTKPPGSLGALEQLSIKLAGIMADPLPRITKKAVVVMAADHGVVEAGVSAYPAEVTGQMLANFASGGAAINVLARLAGAEVRIVDIGVAGDYPPLGITVRKVRPGTSNMVTGAAMSTGEAVEAILVGLEIVEDVIDDGASLVATGDMGIGNTTASAAILAVMSGRNADEVVGRGTGVDGAGVLRKVEAIEAAIRFNQPRPGDPLEVLAKVGGLEIAGLVGVIIGCAHRRVPVIIDGFISGAAALIAAKLEPKLTSYMIASHVSAEAGHGLMLAEIGLVPMLNLEMRLGEGTGAVLAMHLVEAAARILSEMATFDEAGVSTADKGEVRT